MVWSQGGSLAQMLPALDPGICAMPETSTIQEAYGSLHLPQNILEDSLHHQHGFIRAPKGKNAKGAQGLPGPPGPSSFISSTLSSRLATHSQSRKRVHMLGIRTL